MPPYFVNEQVDGLDGLKNLENLYLNHNSIKELESGSFAGLQHLRVLHLGDNALKTLIQLGSLAALESLDLTGNLLTPNRLGGFSSIDNLSSLPKLTKLWLTNNPVWLVIVYNIKLQIDWDKKSVSQIMGITIILLTLQHFQGFFWK